MWIHGELPVYDYRMTMIASLIADDGIVCIGDGLVVDRDRKPIEDKQVKLFEMSPHCVMMPAGGVTEGLEEVAINTATILREQQVQDVTKVASLLRHVFHDSVAPWFTDRSSPLVFFFVGYDSLPNGTFEPKIKIVKNTDGWEGLWEAPKPYSAAGKANIANRIFDNEYPKAKKSLSNLNLLALKALIETEAQHNNLVGGQTTIWDIRPAQPIDRLSQEAIAELKKQL